MATGIDKANLESCYLAAPAVPERLAVARYDLRGLSVSVVSMCRPSRGAIREARGTHDRLAVSRLAGPVDRALH